jgi:hypothetical protein
MFSVFLKQMCNLNGTGSDDETTVEPRHRDGNLHEEVKDRDVA